MHNLLSNCICILVCSLYFLWLILKNIFINTNKVWIPYPNSISLMILLLLKVLGTIFIMFIFTLLVPYPLQTVGITSLWFAHMISWVTLVQRDSTQALHWTSRSLSICSCHQCPSHSTDSQCLWVRKRMCNWSISRSTS